MPQEEALLPPEWTKQLDPPTGKYYYFNKITGASEWETPVDVLRFRGEEIVEKPLTEEQMDVKYAACLRERLAGAKSCIEAQVLESFYYTYL